MNKDLLWRLHWIINYLTEVKVIKFTGWKILKISPERSSYEASYMTKLRKLTWIYLSKDKRTLRCSEYRIKGDPFHEEVGWRIGIRKISDVKVIASMVFSLVTSLSYFLWTYIPINKYFYYNSYIYFIE